MHQKEINNDLKGYLKERKQTKPFWKRMFNDTPKKKEENDHAHEEMDEDVRDEDVQNVSTHEDLHDEDTHTSKVRNVPSNAPVHKPIASHDEETIEELEEKTDEEETAEEEIEEEIEKEEDGLFKKFFKKMKTTDTPKHVKHEDDDFVAPTPKTTASSESDPEMREALKMIHSWITQLPPEKLKEFKASEDFTLYTKTLKKYNLIK